MFTFFKIKNRKNKNIYQISQIFITSDIIFAMFKGLK